MTDFERPKVLSGITVKIKTGYGNLYVTINHTGEGKPIEVFAVLGKSGQSTQAKTEAVGRLTSLCLQGGAPVSAVIKQLEDISGEKPLAGPDGLVKSIPDAVAKALIFCIERNWSQEDGIVVIKGVTKDGRARAPDMNGHVWGDFSPDGCTGFRCSRCKILSDDEEGKKPCLGEKSEEQEKIDGEVEIAHTQ